MKINNLEIIENFDIVKSLAGRDKNKYFLVIYNDESYIYIADGKTRKLEKPKKKKYKHCCLVEKNKNFKLEFLSNKIILESLLLFKKNRLNPEED